MRIDWVKTIGAGSVGLLLSGCVAAVPVAPQLTVVPGPGKTEANLRTDDAACRIAEVGAPQTGTAAQTGATAGATPVAVTADQYYACMASRGESVVQEVPQAVPAVAAYPAYAYPAYAYPAYAYPYGYGYPYGPAYPYYGGWYGPYVGFGVGFGYGRFYGGRGFYHGGFYHGGYGFRGGYGFHGGFRR